MSKIRYFLVQLRTKLWIKPALTGLAAVGWVELAWIIPRLIRFKPPFEVDREVLRSLLEILGSSMLTVAIFAVSAMVAAFASVTTTATPRATRIIMQDRSSQNALAAFLSAFIYAIVSLVALSAFAYGETGRFMLFAGYGVIVIWVLVSFIRWVDQVSKLGRMHDTIRRVEEACMGTFEDPVLGGLLGGHVAGSEEPEGARVFSEKIGYVQYVDLGVIQQCAESMETKVRLLVRPGAFIDRSRPLAVIVDRSAVEDDQREKIAGAFRIGDQRHLEADPRCGLLMLAEIADRALSPAVNDPGTAIAVIGSQIRLLTKWVEAGREEVKVEFPDVEVPALEAADLMDDGFTPIARDGAAMFEVGARLQKAFRALGDLGHPGLTEADRLHAGLSLEQSLAKLQTGHHRQRLREIASRAFPDQEEPA